MSVKVTIYGTEYPVKGDADPDYIKEVAAYVDDKMREVASGLSVKSSTKVAILAALNITDELFVARRDSSEQEEEIHARLTRLTDRVKEARAV
ncbi:MAG: cell division protein ZapA [Candidatus Latescibacteria bacterium]|nr:cell division protein ZapA [Candidatus Latescibacterota bacterium]